ncbi:EAL domain-containing response regulator [Maridesulfovibrio bastinii]|uniref:EAL domain-containing response regulator n=1 Tax=Maridesulfovibrio bastinii TaxID=47157 RepID=UPI000421C65D|nr:EAL domain-containing protein [Maridesulfovibrio bastinii]
MMRKDKAGKPVILFVDDEELVLKSLERLMFYEPFNVKTAGSAAEAMSLLEENHVDVVISDEKMPVKSGSEFLAEVREKYPEICRIMLTGHADLSAAVHAINEGRIFRFLLKPVDLTELVSAVNDFLDERFKSQQKLAFSQQAAGVCSLEMSISEKGEVEYLWSLNTRQMLNLDENAVLDGMDVLYSRVHPDDLQMVIENNGRCTASMYCPEIEFRIVLPDRGERWILQASDGFRRGDGKGYSIVTVFKDITDRLNQREMLHYQAYHDSLTGMGNRSKFVEELEQCLNSSEKCKDIAVMFMDIDNFKLINDSMGHVFGDWLLNSFAARLKDIIPDNVLSARLGGDEFALIIYGAAPITPEKLSLKIINDLKRPFIIENYKIHINVSIGITRHGGRDSVSVDDLLREADTAMYEAKGSDKFPVKFFESSMRDRAADIFRMTGELHQAVEEKEFFLEYQPVVDLATFRLVGFEALVRWNHPEHGLVMPDNFIPLAESNGIIVDLGLLVAEMACSQVAEWDKEKPDNNFFMSFNVSVHQIHQLDFVDKIKKIMLDSGVKPQRFKIEVTESGLMKDIDVSLKVLDEIKELGIGLQIDDFGTGYSSLEYFQRIPADFLKIDKSFITDVNNNPDKFSIVKTIIDLADSVGMRTVAEGVEKKGELSVLRQLGCDLVQGYLFDRPLRSSDAGDVKEYKQFS